MTGQDDNYDDDFLDLNELNDEELVEQWKDESPQAKQREQHIGDPCPGAADGVVYLARRTGVAKARVEIGVAEQCDQQDNAERQPTDQGALAEQSTDPLAGVTGALRGWRGGRRFGFLFCG